MKLNLKQLQKLHTEGQLTDFALKGLPSYSDSYTLASLTELVGETGSTAKIVKVEYRKIDYTYNRLFNFVGSHEKSEYDGELRLTFDNGEGAITRDDLSNFLEKGS